MAKKRGYFSLDLKAWFSGKGRVNRLTYLVTGLYQGVVVYALTAGFNLMGHEASSLLLIIPMLIIMLLLFYAGFCNTRKRLHDIGLPGIAAVVLYLLAMATNVDGLNKALYFTSEALASLVTLGSFAIVFIASLCLLFVPGKRGANRYGPATTEYYGGKGELPKPKFLDE